jgi:hypothetical protein
MVTKTEGIEIKLVYYRTAGIQSSKNTRHTQILFLPS